MSTNQSQSAQSIRAQKKFLRNFKGGFQGEKYYHWERWYKEDAHKAWNEQLNEPVYKELLTKKHFAEIARRAVSIESKTNLLFSFEKMAIRDAVKTSGGDQLFAEGLFDFVYGKADLKTRFENYVKMLASLPRIQTRVLTWPVATVFGFISNPTEHIFLKPRVTQAAAEAYGFDFHYSSKVNWDTYAEYLNFAEQIRKDLKTWKPKDMIDIQSFIWVMGSEEYV